MCRSSHWKRPTSTTGRSRARVRQTNRNVAEFAREFAENAAKWPSWSRNCPNSPRIVGSRARSVKGFSTERPFGRNTRFYPNWPSRKLPGFCRALLRKFLQEGFRQSIWKSTMFPKHVLWQSNFPPKCFQNMFQKRQQLSSRKATLRPESCSRFWKFRNSRIVGSCAECLWPESCICLPPGAPQALGGRTTTRFWLQISLVGKIPDFRVVFRTPSRRNLRMGTNSGRRREGPATITR